MPRARNFQGRVLIRCKTGQTYFKTLHSLQASGKHLTLTGLTNSSAFMFLGTGMGFLRLRGNRGWERSWLLGFYFRQSVVAIGTVGMAIELLAGDGRDLPAATVTLNGTL